MRGLLEEGGAYSPPNGSKINSDIHDFETLFSEPKFFSVRENSRTDPLVGHRRNVYFMRSSLFEG